MSFVTGLQCRECGQQYPQEPLHVCEALLRSARDPVRLRGIKKIDQPRQDRRARAQSVALSRAVADRRRAAGRAVFRLHAAGARPPLRRGARRQGTLREGRLGQSSDLFVQRPRRLGGDFQSDRIRLRHRRPARRRATWPIPWPPTPRRRGSNCYVFIPDGLEQGKIIGSAIYGPKTVAIKGNYDDVNRLCSEIGDKYGWAFVNVNLRPYYSEGAKTHGFEIAEQLGWKLPKHIVVASAGGTILPKFAKGFHELIKVGLVEDTGCKIYSAQAAGCAPIIQALHKGTDLVSPVKPNTIASSIAIGNPADGYYVIQAVQRIRRLGRERHRRGDSRRHQAARPHRRDLHRARRRHRSRRDQEADRAGPHSARRIDRHQHHRQRLQDLGSGGAQASKSRSRSTRRWTNLTSSFSELNRHAGLSDRPLES